MDGFPGASFVPGAPAAVVPAPFPGINHPPRCLRFYGRRQEQHLCSISSRASLREKQKRALIVRNQGSWWAQGYNWGQRL